MTRVEQVIAEWRQIAEMRQKKAWDSVDDSAVSLGLFIDELEAALAADSDEITHLRKKIEARELHIQQLIDEREERNAR